MAQLAINLAVEIAVGTLIWLLTPAQKVQGSRLADLSAPKSNYSVVIPKVWGSVRLAGNLIWANPIREVVKKKKKRRGKGFGTKTEETTYSYYGDFAMLLCAGPIVGVKRIWLNSKLVYNVGTDADASTLANSIKFRNNYLRIHPGSATQLADPLIQASLGIQNTPAYRHRAYIVFHDLPLADYGNRFPALSVEVCTVGRIDATERITDEKAQAATIIREICTSSGLSDEEIDTTEIAAPVTGFFINNSISAREILSQLQQAYFFDCIESAGILRFINSLRPNISENISQNTLSAYEYGVTRPPTFTQTRIQELELPTEVSVTYLDRSLNYAEGMQYSRKSVADNRNTNNISLPVVLTPTEALTIADRLLYLALTRRTSYSFALPLRYIMLEPGDAIAVEFDGTQRIIQISKINIGANLLLEVEALAYSQEIYSYNSIISAGSCETLAANGNTYQLRSGNLLTITGVRLGATTYTPGDDYTYDLLAGRVIRVESGSIPSNATLTICYTFDEVNPPQAAVISGGDTTLRVLDIPLITDSDLDNGLYLAANGGENWRNCTVYVSKSGDGSYELAKVLSTKSTFGTCNTVLQSANSLPFDNINTLSVTIYNGELESVSLADLNNEDNIALVGNEIIRFQNATLTGPLTYNLSNFKRGCRGTESQIATHTVGESFYLLSDYLEQVQGETSDIGKTLLFKAVTDGQSLDEVSPLTIIPSGNSLKPYSPVNLAATKDPLGNITITWTRRDRHAGDRTDYANFPLSEVWEKYEIDIYNGANIVRTISINTPTVTYTDRQQVADFGEKQSTITIRTYQISAIVGRGYASVATLTPNTVYLPPTIQSLNPEKGAIGSTVAIAGSHFTHATAVSFNGTRANFTINSDTVITATVPSDATSGLVTVTTPGGTASI